MEFICHFPQENRIELIDFNPKQESIDTLPVFWKFIVLYYHSINVQTDIYNWQLVHSRQNTFKYNPHPENSGLHAILNTVALIYKQKFLYILPVTPSLLQSQLLNFFMEHKDKPFVPLYKSWQNKCP